MYYCSDFIAFIVDLYNLFRSPLGLAYMRGAFSSRIYVADSRRDSAPSYFGKRGVTLFLLFDLKVLSFLPHSYPLLQSLSSLKSVYFVTLFLVSFS